MCYIFVYLFRDYDDIEKVNQIVHNGSVYCYKNEEEVYQTTFNQIYSGKELILNEY